MLGSHLPFKIRVFSKTSHTWSKTHYRGISFHFCKEDNQETCRSQSRGPAGGVWQEPANQNPHSEDFPGGPVVKTSPSRVGVTGSIPGQGANLPHASWPENQSIKNRNNIVTNSITTLKMVHIFLNLKKKKRPFISCSHFNKLNLPSQAELSKHPENCIAVP